MLLFRTNLATWVNVTKKSVKIVVHNKQKKMEKESEDKVTNVMLVSMFGLAKAGRKRKLISIRCIKNMLYINKHMRNWQVSIRYLKERYKNILISTIDLFQHQRQEK